MRREIMHDLAGYDSGLPHTADLLIWLRAAAKGSVGRVNGPDQGYYRVHGANMHLTDFGDVLTDLRERRKTFETFISTDISDHPRQEYLLRLVHRALAVESVRWAIRSHDLAQDGWQELMQTYGDIATTLWPEISSTRLWSRYRRRASQGHVDGLTGCSSRPIGSCATSCDGGAGAGSAHEDRAGHLGEHWALRRSNGHSSQALSSQSAGTRQLVRRHRGGLSEGIEHARLAGHP